MQKQKILLIEDEQDIADLIKLQAEISGYNFCHYADGLNGFEAIFKEKPDLIILDLMLPGQNGLQVCRQVKASGEIKHIPIIMVTAKSEEADIVLGLELGADDYVTKPFSPRVLLSRVQAVLRRNETRGEAICKTAFGEFELLKDKYQVKKKGKSIALTLSEFSILQRLASNQGKVLTRNQLLDSLQNDDAFVVDRNIDVHVAALRKKLGPSFDYIETVRGVGYRFRDEE